MQSPVFPSQESFSSSLPFPVWFQVHSDGRVVWWFAVPLLVLGVCWGVCAPSCGSQAWLSPPLPWQVLEFLCSPDDDSRHSERQQVRAFQGCSLEHPPRPGCGAEFGLGSENIPWHGNIGQCWAQQEGRVPPQRCLQEQEQRQESSHKLMTFLVKG